MKPKTKPKTVSKLKKELWTVFSRYIRLRDSLEWANDHPEHNGEPMAACVSCRKTIKAFGVGGLQAGHFIPGRNNSILFDERGVHAQCYRCNIPLKGNWVPYRRFMVERYGEEVIEELEELDKTNHQFKPHEVEELIAVYKGKVSKLESLI